MKKIVAAIISVIIVLSVPVAGLPIYAAHITDVYGNTYLAAMADKHDRLHNIQGKKLVLVGGSGMAFGIDSGAIERELDIPTVNMGLYAALGSKTTLDLTRSGITKGDIVVFAPEMDKQAYSLYTNTEITVQTLEAKRSMIRDIPMAEWAALFTELPSYIKDKKELIASGIPDPLNAYSRSAFNGYGDVSYDRPYNVMPDLYLSANMIDITDELIDEDFIEYVNNYAEKVRKKGAAFYFTFPPMNRLALTENSTYENRLAVYNRLTKLLHCEVIGNIEDHIFHEGYFYDSNYHLNNGGVDLNTKKLVGDIKRQLGDDSPTDIAVLPPSGAGSEQDTSGDDMYSEDFEYVEDTAGWAIVAVRPDALNKDVLRVPQTYSGKKVYKIKASAFSGCAASTIYIGENITVLEDGIFADCAKLSAVNLSVKLGAYDLLPTVGDNLFYGANPDVKIYVSASKYTVMCTDYFWMMYKERLDIAR